MENYIFICIGTNQLIEDSFGPRVGELLEEKLKQNSNVEILGTMQCPIHFQNAPIFVDYLKKKQGKFIVIDSALGEEKLIGNAYLSRGGSKIGKAFGKDFYFPAHWNIKVIVGQRTVIVSRYEQIRQINGIAQRLSNQIVEIMHELA